MPRASATPGEGARDTRRPRRPGTIYIHTYIWRCYTARTYVDTIIKSGVPTPWRVPCLPCLAVCPSPSVHVGGSRAEDRRLSYRGVWQCSPRPPVSRGERDDSNDGWEHGGHGRPRLTRGLYGWALRSRIIKGAQRALPCLALPCLAPRPPPRTDWQGASSPSGRVFPNGDPIFSTPSPTRPQGTHTETKDKSVGKKKGPLEEDGGTARWPACSTTFRNGKSRARAPGRRLLSPPDFCYPSSRPSRRRSRSHAITPGCGAEKEGKEREGGRTLSRVWTCAHTRFLGRPAWEVHMHAMQVPADTPDPIHPPAGRPGCRRRSRLARSSEDARLPTCLLSSPSVQQTDMDQGGFPPAAMSLRVPQSSPQTPRRPKYADEQKAQSVQPWPHHIHDTVEYFVHSGTLSIPRPWICPPWPSPSPSPSG